ncbi:MAG: alpha-mannosidase [Clostridia bacterium]|nr:alpha-mannosidase [Clostridia bacterium]
MKKNYMIGNTHFDPVWLWRWDEAMSSITATFRAALQRMEECPDFIYSFATPPVFEWIRKTDPELFCEIKKRVAEGRWELGEGWWLQPDCYTGLGESYVRQGLYGQRYLREHFGRMADTVFNIDSFGHSPMLPQILTKSRLPYYVLCRPERRHITLEHPLFRWVSPDGSRVLAYREDQPYRNLKEAFDTVEDTDEDRLLVYGVTDHGGAPTIAAIREIENRENAVFSSLHDFFVTHDTDYTVEKELITGDFGVYADHPAVKRQSRRAEYALLNAEKATLLAGRNTSGVLGNAWRDLLFNQFHDILGGACIKDAYEDVMALYGRAIATAGEEMHFALQAITSRIKMPGENPQNVWNLVLWNLNAAPFDGEVEAEVQWVHEFPWYDKGIALEDGEGNRYPCQIIREKSVIPRFRSRFLFRAQLPALGYKAFKLIQTGEEVARKPVADPFHMNMPGYSLEISPETGEIVSITDHKTGRTLPGRVLTPCAFVDEGDTWAFNIDSYGEAAEPFSFRGMRVVESGELRTILKADWSFRDSLLSLYYVLYEKEDYLDVRYRVNWNEKHLVLKLLTDLDGAGHRVAVPYGSINRGENQADMPMGGWLETKDFTLLADGVFAYNLVDRVLGLTLLRSPIYGDLRIGVLDADADYDILSQGITEGAVRLHLSPVAPPEILTERFLNPPVVLCEACHGGDLPDAAGYLTLENPGVAVTTLKYAEEGEDIILRGAEILGKAQTLVFTFGGRRYETPIGPYEIFTLRLAGDCLRSVDMLEE